MLKYCAVHVFSRDQTQTCSVAARLILPSKQIPNLDDALSGLVFVNGGRVMSNAWVYGCL